MGVITASAFGQVSRNGSNALSSIMIRQIQHAAATKQILTVPRFRAWLSARAFMSDKPGNTELASAPIHFQNYREPRTDVKMAKGAKRRPPVCPLEQAASDTKLGSLLPMDEERCLVVIGALRRIIPPPIVPSLPRQGFYRWRRYCRGQRGPFPCPRGPYSRRGGAVTVSGPPKCGARDARGAAWESRGSLRIRFNVWPNYPLTSCPLFFHQLIIFSLQLFSQDGR